MSSRVTGRPPASRDRWHKSTFQGLGFQGCSQGMGCMQVKLPVNKPTACTFGGAVLEQLFVTTRVESGENAPEHWGALLSVKNPGISGAASAYVAAL